MSTIRWLLEHAEQVDKTIDMTMRTTISLFLSLVFFGITLALFSYKLEHPIDLSVSIFYVSVFYTSIGLALFLNYLFAIRIGTGIVFAEGLIFTTFFNIYTGIFMSLMALAVFTLWNKAKKYPVYIPCCIMGIIMISAMLVYIFGFASDVPLQKARFMYAVLFGDISTLER